MDNHDSSARRSENKSVFRAVVHQKLKEGSLARKSNNISGDDLILLFSQIWREKYMWVKSFGFLLMLLGGLGFVWSAKAILTGNVVGAITFTALITSATLITYMVDLGERKLGLWRYERVGNIGSLPKFQWRFISWD
ncbi:MAG: hypothetical protein KC447_04520 [Rhodobacteraceae bacterium]|nr:hypothetical protein [Paracoccaceae bacterium]